MDFQASKLRARNRGRDQLCGRRVWRLGLLVVLALAVIAGAGKARSAYAATTITVDCNANPGALATALASASDGDTLAIQGTCKGTFDVARSLTLSGSAGATLDGQAAGTVLTVDVGKTVSVVNLTITGGSGGSAGGILNSGTLTLANSIVSGNSVSTGPSSPNGSGGIFNQAGSVTLTNSTVSGNSASVASLTNGVGGILDFAGSLMLTNSTVSGNSATSGVTNSATVGGILVNGPAGSSASLTFSNSTLSGNSASAPTSAFAGIIDAEPGVISVVNSTVSGNSASATGGPSAFSAAVGGIFNSGGASVSLTSVTLAGNSANEPNGGFLPPVAGVSNFRGTVTALNSLFAGQSGGPNCSGFTTSSDGGYNLDDGTSCAFSTAKNSLSNTNPMLDPAGLKDNGGPTQTIALLPGSPAIDVIPPGANGCGTTLTSDQRGVSRPQGAGCDIGAYELKPQGADLSITKTVAPSPVVSGNQLNYTLTVRNGGPQDATGVTVVDPLPASVHFDRVASTGGPCVRSTTAKPKTKGGTITCSIGNLANGASVTITISVTTTTPGTLTNTATVSGNEPDPSMANNSATATTTVIGT